MSHVHEPTLNLCPLNLPSSVFSRKGHHLSPRERKTEEGRELMKGEGRGEEGERLARKERKREKRDRERRVWGKVQVIGGHRRY